MVPMLSETVLPIEKLALLRKLTNFSYNIMQLTTVRKLITIIATSFIFKTKGM
tara:strand:- start:1530 stop:1688 length:159 start_codon:yes stop_codon:yes gene_type:complete